MPAFRVIFRLDFATANFEMCDRAGAALRVLHDAGPKFFTDLKESFQNRLVWGSNTDPEGRWFYQVQMDALSVNFLYETADGFSLTSIETNERLSKFFSVSENLLDIFKISNLSRAGLRLWILDSVNAGSVLDTFLGKIDGSMKDAFGNLDDEASDICLTFEGQYPDKVKYRISTGPYSNDEAQKYFQHTTKAMSSKEDYNVLLDVDLFVEQFALTISPRKWARPLFRHADNVATKVATVISETQDAKYH
jgi:hypothetical protein